MTYYQIGTAEPRNCVGSRAAKSNKLAEAKEECRQRSLERGIRQAWLRPVHRGQLGPVMVAYAKGVEQPV
jgi:hypothetical protein